MRESRCEEQSPSPILVRQRHLAVSLLDPTSIHDAFIAVENTCTGCSSSFGDLEGTDDFFDSLGDLDMLSFTELLALPPLPPEASPSGISGTPAALTAPILESTTSTLQAKVDMPQAQFDGQNRERDQVRCAGNETCKLPNNQFSQGNAGLASTTISTPSEKLSAEKRGPKGKDFGKNLQEKPKKKRYWPKIAGEEKPRKASKSRNPRSSTLATPKPSTPATPKPSTPVKKRKYTRRKKPEPNPKIDEQKADEPSSSCATAKDEVGRIPKSVNPASHSQINNMNTQQIWASARAISGAEVSGICSDLNTRSLASVDGMTGCSFPVSHSQMEDCMNGRSLLFPNHEHKYDRNNQVKDKDKVCCAQNGGSNLVNCESSEPVTVVGLDSTVAAIPSENCSLRMGPQNVAGLDESEKSLTIIPLTPEKSVYIAKKILEAFSGDSDRQLIYSGLRSLEEYTQVVDPNVDRASKSCRRSLNFDLEEDHVTERNPTIHQSQPQNKSSEKNSTVHLEDMELVVEQDCAQIDSMMEIKTPADTSGVLSQLGCRDKFFQVYRRTFLLNQCLKRLGINCPRTCKKRRMRRKKVTMPETLLSPLVAQDGQIRIKESSSKRNVIARYDKLGPSNAELAPELVPTKPQEVRKISSLGIIATTEAQSPAAICDPDSFRCILSLKPSVKSKRQRSKRFMRKQNLALPTTNPNCSKMLSTPPEQAPNSGKQGRKQNRIKTSPHNAVPLKKQKNVVVTAKSSKEVDEIPWLDSIIQRFEILAINKESLDINKELALVPYEELDPSEKCKAEVDLDPLTMIVWRVLMENDGNEDLNEDNEEAWKEQREVFRGRMASFLSRMHHIQGNRRFSRWKGSVLDSVVGVFLTQNVSDHLSSSAFLSLAAQFPVQSRTHEDEEMTYCLESMGSSTVADGEGCDANGKLPLPHENEGMIQDREVKVASNGEACHANGKLPLTHEIEGMICVEDREEKVAQDQEACRANGKLPLPHENEGMTQDREEKIASDGEACFKNGKLPLTHEIEGTAICVEDREERVAQDGEASCYANGKLPLSHENEGMIHAVEREEKVVTLDMPHESTSPTKIRSKERKKKGEEKTKKVEEEAIDWDDLRKTYSRSRVREAESMDSVDWEAVRQATKEEFAKIIKERGMNQVIAERTKAFLNRMVRDHGSLNLEWLRDVPPDKVKEYLLSIEGLGLKSVECLRLLSLHLVAFPVDTNVGRVAVRLGWVPLKPLPGTMQMHDLDQYPLVDKVQKYLWPRLCNLDHRTLYELHYQLITFGKVFCTKRSPNCHVCPMQGECKHFASEYESARRGRLTAPQEGGSTADPALPKAKFMESRKQRNDYEPIVEMPASPEPEGVTEGQAVDIEDLFLEPEGHEMASMRLNTQEFKENLAVGFLNNYASSLPLVVSTPQPKTKYVSRLRTKHIVYELPDSHELLTKLDLAPREPGDPNPYLLAIWMSGEKEQCNSIDEYYSQTVPGTILIPSRTATRGRFPLNGTYFQTNEVFADHESSQRPIDVPKYLIYSLQNRNLYCGTSATTVFRGLSLMEIQFAFLGAFICIRGFNRKTRAPRPLAHRFHLSVMDAMEIRRSTKMEGSNNMKNRPSTQ